MWAYIVLNHIPISCVRFFFERTTSTAIAINKLDKNDDNLLIFLCRMNEEANILQMTSSNCKQTETNRNLSENEKRNSCYTTHFLHRIFLSSTSASSPSIFISLCYHYRYYYLFRLHMMNCNAIPSHFTALLLCVVQKTIELVNFSLVFRSNLLHIDHCIAFIVVCSAVLCSAVFVTVIELPHTEFKIQNNVTDIRINEIQ